MNKFSRRNEEEIEYNQRWMVKTCFIHNHLKILQRISCRVVCQWWKCLWSLIWWKFQCKCATRPSIDVRVEHLTIYYFVCISRQSVCLKQNYCGSINITSNGLSCSLMMNQFCLSTNDWQSKSVSVWYQLDISCSRPSLTSWRR